MEQFSLDKWLEDQRRKVVTRLKKSVQIISIEGKEDMPIVALVEGIAHQYKPNGYHADVVVAYSNQCRDMGDYDLFFADEEDELTEFEKELVDLVSGWCDSHVETPEEYISKHSRKLLDLARKEIENSIEDGAIEFAKSYMEDVNPSFEKVQESEELWKWKMSCLRGINKAYRQGKEDALNDLPRWRKSDRNWITNICDLATIVKCDGGDHEDFDSVVVSNRVDKDDYYIELGELLKLQKEE